LLIQGDGISPPDCSTFQGIPIPQKARQAIQDNELLAQFKAVEAMDTKDQSTIKEVIDALIKRSRLSKIAAL